MTASQKSLHWRLWARACRVQGWRMEKGRLLIGPNPSAPALQVMEVAESIAFSEVRSMDLDDLRHALYSIAASVSSIEQVGSTDQFSRVLGWLRLLIDDSDLEAAMLIDDSPEGRKRDERSRQVFRIRHLAAPMAVINKICRDKFGPVYTAPYWEDLPLHALRQLALTLERWQRNHRQAAAPAPSEICNLKSEILAAADCPF